VKRSKEDQDVPLADHEICLPTVDADLGSNIILNLSKIWSILL
jgi:hypothetical protein